MTRAREKLIIVGTLKNYETFKKKYAFLTNESSEILPYQARFKSSTFLNWMLLSAIREQYKISPEIVAKADIVSNSKHYIHEISDKEVFQKDWHEYYNRHDPDGKHIPVANVTIKQWIQSDLDKINHLKKLYRNYNKVSYAKIDSITSVSKLKVAKPINDLDPVGRIQLSKETMDEIDQALARKLLSGPWRRIDKQTE